MTTEVQCLLPEGSHSQRSKTNRIAPKVTQGDTIVFALPAAVQNLKNVATNSNKHQLNSERTWSCKRAKEHYTNADAKTKAAFNVAIRIQDYNQVCTQK